MLLLIHALNTHFWHQSPQMIQSLWNLTGTSAAVLLICLSIFQVIEKLFGIQISGLDDFPNYCSKIFFIWYLTWIIWIVFLIYGINLICKFVLIKSCLNLQLQVCGFWHLCWLLLLLKLQQSMLIQQTACKLIWFIHMVLCERGVGPLFNLLEEYHLYIRRSILRVNFNIWLCVEWDLGWWQQLNAWLIVTIMCMDCHIWYVCACTYVYKV